MYDEQVTVLVPTSPIPRHPDTSLIEECLQSVRFYFPSCRIVVMADGVREQVAHRKEQYEQYKNVLLQKLPGYGLGPSDVFFFHEYTQQCGMTSKVLQTVTTPNILFMEHDAILRRDPPINFEAIFGLLCSGRANLVRFYNWAEIWHEHRALMRGELGYAGATFVKTVQYSQWPLVSNADYHRRLLRDNWKGDRKMIETVMYGPVVAQPWEHNKIVIYLDGGLAFTHRDGRADETGKRDPSEW